MRMSRNMEAQINALVQVVFTNVYMKKFLCFISIQTTEKSFSFYME